jgi:hypothetical protein
MLLVVLLGGCVVGDEVRERRRAGAACSSSSDCASGYCVGFGCGGEGSCVDPGRERACGPDAIQAGFVPACTCEGEQLEAIRPECPPEPIAGYGSCEYVLANLADP